MRVGSADAEGTNPRAARFAVPAFPFRQFRVDVEGAVRKVNPWVFIFKIEAGRKLPVLEREYCLNETSHPGSSIQMADVRLPRTNAAKSLRLCAITESPRQCLDFDRVSESCSGSVSLDVSDGF